MSATPDVQIGPASWVRRHAVATYFLLTFAISWTGAFLVVAPHLLRGTEIPKFSGILIFPAMLLGPVVPGMVMAGVTDGRAGIGDLFARMNPARIAPSWWTALLIPPALVLIVLMSLKHFVSPSYAPNHFWLGVAFGVPAGLFEEIGWTGFAFPKMRLQRSPLGAAVLLGILWGIWHLPAINYLGAATPHGRYWFAFFLAFTLAMMAMRVLIAWLYQNTESLLLVQLMHISSTGALVVFSPPVKPPQEVIWYLVYGCLLWLVVIIIRRTGGRQLIAG